MTIRIPFLRVPYTGEGSAFTRNGSRFGYTLTRVGRTRWARVTVRTVRA